LGGVDEFVSAGIACCALPPVITTPEMSVNNVRTTRDFIGFQFKGSVL
jgi:hypothetical protein